MIYFAIRPVGREHHEKKRPTLRSAIAEGPTDAARRVPEGKLDLQSSDEDNDLEPRLVENGGLPDPETSKITA